MNKWGKRAAIAVAGVVVTGLASFGFVSMKAKARLAEHYETHRISLPLPAEADAAAVARGEHLVKARYACGACHGPNLAGGVMLDNGAIGSLLGPNLTRGQGSRTAGYGMADWDRIVRHGVKPDGTPALMPSEDFFKMSDAELSDIVAYVRSVPPVDAAVPAPKLGPVGKALIVFGKFPISAEHQASYPHPSQPPPTADSVEFGAHLVATCVTCHRQNLAGGHMAFGPPDWPAAANLTPHQDGLRDWSYEDFDKALTIGVSKDGRSLRSPMAEVVQGTKAMNPTERRAIWTYLRGLAASATNQG
ncbi:MAG TPA: c-type cytochrome [Polyangiaceae bacterium]|nr:c-type cytochrome [Polyangiaceae bacterium]